MFFPSIPDALPAVSELPFANPDFDGGHQVLPVLFTWQKLRVPMTHDDPKILAQTRVEGGHRCKRNGHRNVKHDIK